MILRWLTGLVVAGVSLLLAWAGGSYWLGYVLVLLAVAGVEWATLGRSSQRVVPLCLVLAYLALVGHRHEVTPLLLLVAAVPMLVSQEPDRVSDVLWTGAGILWLALPAALLYFLRQEYGFAVLVVLLLGTWVQDSLALYVGKAVGYRPLAPGLSPNKTWAGSVGAILGMALVLGAGSVHLNWPPVPSLLVGLLIGALGQVGDLSVSALKRRIDAQDTGTFFPGHGGILDRVDALVVNVVVFYPFCRYLESFP